MRLAAIYNVFKDSIELLPYSLNCLKGHVDEIIIVYQTVSNWGEVTDEYELFSDNFIENLYPDALFTYKKYSPRLSWGAMVNETAKRNLGVKTAIEHGCTHALCMDCDEMYEDFAKAKQQYIDSGAKASVCSMWTYFKEPTLRLENKEGYFVPFISELNEDSKVGNFKSLFYCDPTRKPNHTDVVLIDETMHHFSYVRSDINMKVRNSTAKRNIEKGTIMEDYNNPNVKEGFYIRDFGQKLIRTNNIFNIEICNSNAS